MGMCIGLEERLAKLAGMMSAPSSGRPGLDPREILVGVDLGTACVVAVAVDLEGNPLAGEMQYAEVVRDGLIVDYIGAREITAGLFRKIVEAIGVRPLWGATGYPPETGYANINLTRHVVESLGLEVVSMADEPSAANSLLNLEDGAIVDIGGGTTGIAVIKDGEIVHVADEPTGGHHITLVISGNRGIPYSRAEEWKRDGERGREMLPIVRPVIEKMASIVRRHVEPYGPKEIHLVGGTVMLEGFADVMAGSLGRDISTPPHPQLITPLGIAAEGVKALGGVRKGSHRETHPR